MSFVKSPALNPADLHDALQTALIEVSENAYFVFVEPADAAEFADAVGLVKDTWLKASVTFEGSFEGAVEITLPEPLGQWLVTSLLGMQGDERLGEPQQFDGVGEFANMVCGAWLSRLSDDCLFELRTPAVTRMTEGWTPLVESRGRQELICRMVTINELPMRVLIRSGQQAA
jgi:CheY-specific phosphatase CheX